MTLERIDMVDLVVQFILAAAVLALLSLPAQALEMDRTLTRPSKTTNSDNAVQKEGQGGAISNVKDEDDARRKYRADEFLSHLQGIDDTRGIEGLRRIGKVLKEDVHTIQNRFDASKTDEVRSIQFQGMSISTYITQIDGRLKMIVTDVVITSPKWPVKYGLMVGVSREKVEELLGRDGQFAKPPRRDQWYYGDGLGGVTFTFDNLDKVESIQWSFDLD